MPDSALQSASPRHREPLLCPYPSPTRLPKQERQLQLSAPISPSLTGSPAIIDDYDLPSSASFAITLASPPMSPEGSQSPPLRGLDSHLQQPIEPRNLEDGIVVNSRYQNLPSLPTAHQRPEKHRLVVDNDEPEMDSRKRRKSTALPMEFLDEAHDAVAVTAPATVSTRPVKHALSPEDDRTIIKRRRMNGAKSEDLHNFDIQSNAVHASHDAGSAFYKLSTSRIPISLPHPTQDLQALYNLNDLAGTVARKNPTTGEKINKLRKSYEGKVKDLNVFGKNKAVPRPGEFTEILLYPDEEWDVQKVAGKDIDFDISEEFLSRLQRAVLSESGQLPNEAHERWKNLLYSGEETIRPGQRQESLEVNRSQSHIIEPQKEPPRPKRRGTKRRYNDDSFEGYGEGYTDDMAEAISVDGDDDERGGLSAKRRRRKDSASSQHFTVGISSYGSSTVIVGNGSSSF